MHLDPAYLKPLHLIGVCAIFASFGATLLAGSAKKSVAMLHGLALVLVLLAGFALLGKPVMNQAWWMLKLCIWIFLGAAPVLAKRKVLPPFLIFVISLALVGVAAWLARRPF